MKKRRPDDPTNQPDTASTPSDGAQQTPIARRTLLKQGAALLAYVVPAMATFTMPSQASADNDRGMGMMMMETSPMMMMGMMMGHDDD